MIYSYPKTNIWFSSTIVKPKKCWRNKKHLPLAKGKISKKNYNGLIASRELKRTFLNSTAGISIFFFFFWKKVKNAKFSRMVSDHRSLCPCSFISFSIYTNYNLFLVVGTNHLWTQQPTNHYNPKNGCYNILYRKKAQRTGLQNRSKE